VLEISALPTDKGLARLARHKLLFLFYVFVGEQFIAHCVGAVEQILVFLYSQVLSESQKFVVSLFRDVLFY